MLYRKREKDIKNWLNSDEKAALLVTGARQTGKTFLIRECLKAENKDFVEFNLIENSNIPYMLKETEGMGASAILTRLNAISDHPFVKGQTIIFLDEIQEYKEIATLIKFLVDEGSYRYILSGSLLGVELNSLRSAPVGYMRTIEMFPLDLEEFYTANGLSHEAFEMLRNSFTNRIPVTNAVHNKLMAGFINYLIVGGMPQAVQTFIDTSDLNKVIDIHNTIIPGYIKDFSKYETEDRRLRLRKIYDLIPAELASKNKRYIFNDLDKNFRPEKYSTSFDWLINAGVAIAVYNVTEPKVPLLISEKSNLFKLFLSDVGMLTTMYGKATVQALLGNNKTINYGAVYENFTAQELHAHGFKGYYFNSKKLGETDFLIENNMTVVPIEVKSGKDYQIHQALNNILANKEFRIREAYVLCNGNIRTDGIVCYLPIYMTMFIEKDNIMLPNIQKTDLRNL